jgi:hypothetical protein
MHTNEANVKEMGFNSQYTNPLIDWLKTKYGSFIIPMYHKTSTKSAVFISAIKNCILLNPKYQNQSISPLVLP